MINKVVPMILVLALSATAQAMVFSWTDSSGIKHFTNKRDEIPERYRSKAKPLYPEQTDALPGQPSPPQPVRTDLPPAAPVVVQQAKPLELPKAPQPVVVPEAPKRDVVPVQHTRNRERRRPAHQEDE